MRMTLSTACRQAVSELLTGDRTALVRVVDFHRRRCLIQDLDSSHGTGATNAWLMAAEARGELTGHYGPHGGLVAVSLAEQPDAGLIIRQHLMSALTAMVERYTAEHFDGRPINPSHAESLVEYPNGQVEDFLHYMIRQPELISFVEGKIYALDMPELVEIDPETGEEVLVSTLTPK